MATTALIVNVLNVVNFFEIEHYLISQNSTISLWGVGMSYITPNYNKDGGLEKAKLNNL